MGINFNNEIQYLEEGISKDSKPERDQLIKQTFIAWYALVERIDNPYLNEIIQRNMVLMQKFYPKAADVLFMKGWMISISPWYFNIRSSEEAKKYLKLVYKYNPNNQLYKWALSDELNLTTKEQQVLESIILEKIEKFCVDYWPIKEYFRNLIERKI